MKNTTLCYLEQGGCYLMLHRTKDVYKRQLRHCAELCGRG